MTLKRMKFPNMDRGGGPGPQITAAPLVEPRNAELLRIIQGLKTAGKDTELWEIITSRDHDREVIVAAVDAFLELHRGYFSFNRIPEDHKLGYGARDRFIEKVSETLVQRIKQAEASGNLNDLITVLFRKESWGTSYYATTDINYASATLEFANALARNGTYKAFEILNQLIRHQLPKEINDEVYRLHSVLLERLISEEKAKAEQKLQRIMKSDPDLNIYTMGSVFERVVYYRNHRDEKCGDLYDLVFFNETRPEEETKAAILITRFYGQEEMDSAKRLGICKKLASALKEIKNRGHYAIVESTLRKQLTIEKDSCTRKELFAEMKKAHVEVSRLFDYYLRITSDQVQDLLRFVVDRIEIGSIAASSISDGVLGLMIFSGVKAVNYVLGEIGVIHAEWIANQSIWAWTGLATAACFGVLVGLGLLDAGLEQKKINEMASKEQQQD